MFLTLRSINIIRNMYNNMTYIYIYVCCVYIYICCMYVYIYIYAVYINISICKNLMCIILYACVLCKISIIYIYLILWYITIIYYANLTYSKLEFLWPKQNQVPHFQLLKKPWSQEDSHLSPVLHQGWWKYRPTDLVVFRVGFPMFFRSYYLWLCSKAWNAQIHQNPVTDHHLSHLNRINLGVSSGIWHSPEQSHQNTPDCTVCAGRPNSCGL